MVRSETGSAILSKFWSIYDQTGTPKFLQAKLRQTHATNMKATQEAHARGSSHNVSALDWPLNLVAMP